MEQSQKLNISMILEAILHSYYSRHSSHPQQTHYYIMHYFILTQS